MHSFAIEVCNASDLSPLILRSALFEPVTIIADNSRRGLRIAGVLGSMVVHLGAASYFLLPSQHQMNPTNHVGTAQKSDLVTVSIVPASPSITDSHDLHQPKRRESLHFGSARLTPIGHAQAGQAATGEKPAVSSSANDGNDETSAQPSSQMPTSSVAAIGLDYQQRLEQHIAQFQGDGPRGISGIVYLQVLMDRSGNVQGIWVIKSSGSPVLDDEAIATVRRAAPLLPIPQELPDQLMISLPMRWSVAPLLVERSP